MAAITATRTGLACNACVLMAANGECDGLTDREPLALLGDRDILDYCPDREPHFASGPCIGCGTTVGDDYHEAEVNTFA